MVTVAYSLFRFLYARLFRVALFICARTADGAEQLLQTIGARLSAAERIYRLKVPGQVLYHLGSLFRTGAVLDQIWTGDLCTVTVRMRPQEYHRLLGQVPTIAVSGDDQ